MVQGASLRLAEVVGMLALGQDSAFGQPMGSQHRSCLMATALGAAAGLARAERSDVYWLALLRYVGCTGHAHEVAAVFGDDVATRARSVIKDFSDPRQLLPEILRHAGGEATGIGHVKDVLAVLAGGRQFVEMNFRTGCEVADELAARLDLSASLRAALSQTFEQWNGKGSPNGQSGEHISLPMRIVRLAHDAEALIRIRGLEAALVTLSRRAGRLYDPDLVTILLPVAAEIMAAVDKIDPWDGVLAAEPDPFLFLHGSKVDRALLVVADFIDLKSPYTIGHSRAVAELACAAAQTLGMPADDVLRLRRAAWLHDFGRTAIPNSIWDRAEPLTRADVDRIELHPLLTEQILRRCPALSTETGIAALHHERLDGSGYARGLQAAALALPARVLAVADRYQDMVSDRAYRPALSARQAALEIGRRVNAGRLDAQAADAVLSAAGEPAATMSGPHPAVLTAREIQVVRLAVQGLTVARIARVLGISRKTVDTHIQHVYTKAQVSTRGALALYAVQRGLLSTGIGAGPVG